MRFKSETSVSLQRNRGLKHKFTLRTFRVTSESQETRAWRHAPHAYGLIPWRSNHEVITANQHLKRNIVIGLAKSIK